MITRLALALALFGCATEEDGTTTPVDITACKDEVLLAQTFDVVDNAETEVQVGLEVFAGKVWAGYTGREGNGSTGNLDTFITEVSCTGQATKPLVVNTREGRNDVDPVLRRGKDTMLIAWSSDNGSGGENNLDIVYRVMADDGTFVTPSEIDVESKDGTETVEKNHWLPQAARFGDGFMIAGVRGVEGGYGFQVFSESLDAMGASTKTIAPAADGGNSYGYPDIVESADGGARVIWEQTPKDSDDTVVREVTIPTGGPWPMESKSVQDDTVAAQPRYGRGNWKYQAPAVIRDANQNVLLVSIAKADGSGDASATVGSNTRVNHLPNIAMSENRAVITWHEVIGGTTNKVLYAELSFDGNEITVGEAKTLSETALPYGPAIVHVRDDIFLIAWTATLAAGDRKIKAQFVQLATR